MLTICYDFSSIFGYLTTIYYLSIYHTLMEIIAKNRKAYYQYEILEKIEAGIALTGTEVKSIRNRDVSINESFAHIHNNEVFIHEMHIGQYKQGNRQKSREIRTGSKPTKPFSTPTCSKRLTCGSPTSGNIGGRIAFPGTTTGLGYYPRRPFKGLTNGSGNWPMNFTNFLTRRWSQNTRIY